MNRTKVFGMIKQAQSLKADVKALEENATVQKYLALVDERKALHQTIGKHVERYNVLPSQYKPAGLVTRESTWVKVADVRAFAEAYPTLKALLLKLINSKMVYYTK